MQASLQIHLKLVVDVKACRDYRADIIDAEAESDNITRLKNKKKKSIDEEEDQIAVNVEHKQIHNTTLGRDKGSGNGA